MEELKAALLGPHQVRKTYDQKSAFIAWVREYAARMGHDMQIQESGKWVRSRNLVFGDAEHAKTLITAHYDTCARLPFPNFMTPACWPVILLTQILVPVVLFGALGYGLGYGLGRLARLLALPKFAAALIASLLPAALILGLAALMLVGPANPHTANDNTSGVMLLLMAMKRLKGCDDVAFVLFDNEEKGLLGSSAYAKAHKEQTRRAFVVNLDCVSDGDTLMYAGTRAAMRSAQGKKLAGALEAAALKYGKRAMSGESPKVFYPSDQVCFKRGTALAALKGEKILYLDRIHTIRDTALDESNLCCLLEALASLAQ